MKEIGQLSKSLSCNDLPFLKRFAYRDEKEYRIICTDMCEDSPVADYAFELSSISRITLSPWMPTVPASSVRKVIKELPGCSSLKVCISKLVQTDGWKKLSTKLAVE